MINLVDAMKSLRAYLDARHGRAVYCAVHVEIAGYSALHGGPDRIEVSLYTSEAGPGSDRHHFAAPTLEAAWGLMVAHHAAQDAVADPVVELPA